MPPPRRTRHSPGTAFPIIQAPHPLSYILFKHQSALSALSSGMISPTMPIAHEASRSLAIQVVEGNGWMWPTILDTEFPPATEGGLKYERVTIEFVSMYSFFFVGSLLIQLLQWPELLVSCHSFRNRNPNAIATPCSSSPVLYIHSTCDTHLSYSHRSTSCLSVRSHTTKCQCPTPPTRFATIACCAEPEFES